MKKTFALLTLTAALCGQAFAATYDWSKYPAGTTQPDLTDDDVMVVDTSTRGTSIGVADEAGSLHIKFISETADSANIMNVKAAAIGMAGLYVDFDDNTARAWEKALNSTGSVTLMTAGAGAWDYITTTDYFASKIAVTLNNAAGYDKITLGGTTYDLIGVVATVPTDLAVGQLAIVAPQYGKAITLATGVSVPEPATATLSLLALAGLAARRRRK